MGNCFSCFSFVLRDGDDLTTLNNSNDDRNLDNQINRQESHLNSNRTRSSWCRNQQQVII